MTAEARLGLQSPVNSICKKHINYTQIITFTSQSVKYFK